MDSVRVTIRNGSDYGDHIRAFLTDQIPMVDTTEATKLDLLTSAVVGNCFVRFGQLPERENLAVVRSTIQTAVDNNKPIPILVPWGSKKPNNGPLDVAEIGALKQLAGLQERVLRYHPAGVQIRLRLEDASGYYLYDDDPGARPAIDQYTRDFCGLVQIMGLSFLKVVPENALFSDRVFEAKTNEVVPVMGKYLDDTEAPTSDWKHLHSWQQLHDLTGIQGEISTEQRTYYRRLYASLYPGITTEGTKLKLARYLSSALVRGKLKGRGEDPVWNGKYLQVTFAPPVPGSPRNMVRHFLYYRALPSRSAHTPPWRSKGWLCMHQKTAVPKIANWRAAPSDLVECPVALSKGNDSVSVSTDYLVMN